MKILCFIDSLSSGGAQNQMINLSIGLSELNYKIDLVTYFPLNFFEYRIENNEKINRIQLEKKDKIGVNVILDLIRLIKVNKYDFALSFLETPNFYLVISKLFCKFKYSFYNFRKE